MLEGLRVVEFATHVAATSAGGIMEEWGADVLKIEQPGGDPYRYSMARMGAKYKGAADFDMHNRGKRSMVLDLKAEGAREVFDALIAQADVFITNKLPKSLTSLKIEWADLQKINPKLVYGSLTGCGLRGEDINRPGLDQSVFWSRAGLNHLTTLKGEDPLPLRRAIGDRYTGLSLFAGIMAALWERQSTGKGRLVEASLLRTGVYAAGTDFANYLRIGRVGSSKSRHESANPIQNYFKTKDERWICLQPGDGQMLPEALGHPELLEDERFTTIKGRRDNAKWLVDTLDKIFAERSLDEWRVRLDAAHVVWSPVQTLPEAVKDPQVIASGAFVEVPDHEGPGTYKAPAMPVGFPNAEGGWDGGPRGPSPRVGEHTDDVLTELGFDADTTKALKASGALG